MRRCKHPDQPVHIVHVQSGGGLVQQHQGLARGPAAQLRGQLHPLGFAAGQGGAGLAQLHVAQAHVVERAQLLHDGLMGLEHAHGFLHGQIQHVGDGQALVLDLQRFPVVALAVAHLAGHVNIRHEVHFDFQQPVAGAGLATPALHVEGEAVLLIAADLGLRQLGEHLADHVEQAGIGGGVGAGRAADGRLVDADDLVQLLHALDAVISRFPGPGAVQKMGQRAVEDRVHQAALAAAGYARHAAEHAQGESHVDVL